MHADARSHIAQARAPLQRSYGILSNLAPELIAMGAGLRVATQLSLSAAERQAQGDHIERFCAGAGLHLRWFERRGFHKALLSRRDLSAADMRDEPLLGTLFGYPPCCIERFVRHTDAAAEPFINGVDAWLGDARALDHRLNIFLRPSPFHLITHFPCAPDCAPSLALAERLLRAIRERNADLAARIVTFGRAPVLYTDVCGAGVVFRGTLEGPRLRYESLHCELRPQSLLHLATKNTPADTALHRQILDALLAGDALELRGTELVISAARRVVQRFARPPHLAWRLVDFV